LRLPPPLLVASAMSAAASVAVAVARAQLAVAVATGGRIGARLSVSV
jgi:hypothetical protein